MSIPKEFLIRKYDGIVEPGTHFNEDWFSVHFPVPASLFKGCHEEQGPFCRFQVYYYHHLMLTAMYFSASLSARGSLASDACQLTLLVRMLLITTELKRINHSDRSLACVVQHFNSLRAFCCVGILSARIRKKAKQVIRICCCRWHCCEGSLCFGNNVLMHDE